MLKTLEEEWDSRYFLRRDKLKETLAFYYTTVEPYRKFISISLYMDRDLFAKDL